MNFNYLKLISATALGVMCLIVSTYLLENISPQSPILIQGTEMSEVKISVSVDDAHLSQIQQVSQELKSSGMNVEKTLSSIGVIRGSIAKNKINNLSRVTGVESVESQQGYQLSPPDSDIQ